MLREPPVIEFIKTVTMIYARYNKLQYQQGDMLTKRNKISNKEKHKVNGGSENKVYDYVTLMIACKNIIGKKLNHARESETITITILPFILIRFIIT